MKILKRIVSLMLVGVLSINILYSLPAVRADIINDGLTPEQIAAKNYPVPSGYSAKTVLQSYDSAVPGAISNSSYTVSQSNEAGTFYNGASMKYTTVNNYREIKAFSSTKTLDGDGFCFWYKSSTSVAFRLRSSSNEILNYGSMPASENGSWVTVYYYGKTDGLTYNTSSVTTNFKSRVDNGETLSFNIMSTNTSFCCYIDEFFTFEANETQNDIYENDSEFFKFSLKKMNCESKTLASYGEDGSVTLTSAYGSAASQYPVNITYDVDPDAVGAAIKKANSGGGSGYLQISLDNISCQNAALNATEGLKFILTLGGTGQQLIRYNFEVGAQSTYLIDVKNVTDASLITSVNVELQSCDANTKIANIQTKLSPITVYELPLNSNLYQAEDLNPTVKLSETGQTAGAGIFKSSDSNNTYAYIPSSFSVGGYLEMTLPNAEVGQYNVYVRSLDLTSRSTFMFTANALNPIKNIDFAQNAYASYGRDTLRNIGTVTITKNGNAKLRFTSTAKVSTSLYVDYIVLEKIGTAVAEPESNFTIKDYPAMDRYEVKTILNTWDDYICGTDPRYTDIQVYGYIGDGNAYNLNSRGTVNKTWFDNNNLVNYIKLDGDGIRFWYKASSGATLQFCASGAVKYSVSLAPIPNGGWVTVYYTSLVANGDVSDITRIALKTSSTAAYYVDEMHTIEEKLGEVQYSVIGDTATVTGYDLRLEDVVIASEYQGYPVVSISAGAFKGNKTLKSVVLPNTIQTIGDEAFSSCLNLASVTFGTGVTTIGNKAFYGCEKLGETIMPASINNISPSAFSGCGSLTLNVLPNSYAKDYSITNNVRYKCNTADGYIYICYNKAVSVNGYTGSAQNIAVPSKIDGFDVTSIDAGAFKNNNIVTSVIIPDTVLAVCDSAFENCPALKSVKMSNLVGSSIGAYAFASCTALNDINLGTGVTVIGDSAFKDCISLAQVYLPSQLTQIAAGAFGGCTGIVVSMEPNTYAYTYVNTVGLKYIPDTLSNFKYSVINYKATIIGYTGTSQAIAIPSSIDGYTVTAVGVSAFLNNTLITSLAFPDTVTLIDETAFCGCTKLWGIDFGGVRKINSYAFAYCTSLTALTVLDLVDISSTAFTGCTNLNLNIEKTQFLRSAADYVKGITVGFNLGNTFEAYSDSTVPGTITPEQSETLWGAPVTTQAMVDFAYNSGFNAIRIPITWQAFLDENYKIDPAYMARIKEVVSYAQNRGMYIIIDLHHDTWVNLSTPDFEALKTNFATFWAGVADEFKFYDEKLIFESVNECRYDNDWYGMTDEIFQKYNELNQVFYNVVRNSGGLNDRRYLMLETYAGQFGARQINPFWLPDNDNHIIASVHMYINTMSAGDYTYNLQYIYNSFVAKGTPCIIGEVGIPNWYDETYCAEWATFFLNMCKSYDLKCFFWDDHGNYTIMNRASLTWKYPAFVDAIAAATRPDDQTPVPVYLVGDLNVDGAIDISDLILLKQHLLKLKDITAVSGMAADIDNDGYIGVADLVLLKKHILKLIDITEYRPKT